MSHNGTTHAIWRWILATININQNLRTWNHQLRGGMNDLNRVVRRYGGRQPLQPARCIKKHDGEQNSHPNVVDQAHSFHPRHIHHNEDWLENKPATRYGMEYVHVEGEE